ncbi:MAG: hypothetical protein R2850_10525 [Bacteroidia bacterium]
MSAYDSIAAACESEWAFGPWYPDADISNGVMYNPSKLGLASSFAFQTLPRKTHVYKFYFINQNFNLYPDTVYLTFLSVHFKSSQGSTNENTRLIQATDIYDYIRVFHPSNLALSGDYNLYTSSEPAYQKLIDSGADRLDDPINRPGNWNNNSSFADIHTQSPRTTSFDGGVTGGLDDRFDFILLRPEIMNGTGGLHYINNTYRVPGNDGLHFNHSILDLPVNESVPDSVLQALHAMSDHLPVILDLEFDPSQVSTSLGTKLNQECDVYQLINMIDENPEYSVGAVDLSGREVDLRNIIKTRISGFYFVSAKCNSVKSTYFKLQITPAGDLLFSQ